MSAGRLNKEILICHIEWCLASPCSGSSVSINQADSIFDTSGPPLFLSDAESIAETLINNFSNSNFSMKNF